MKKKLWLLALLLLFPLAACGEVYSVSPQGMSMTQALALCRDGDVLELGGGIYDAARGGNFSISVAYDKYPIAVKLHLADLEATYLREKETSAVNK